MKDSVIHTMTKDPNIKQDQESGEQTETQEATTESAEEGNTEG